MKCFTIKSVTQIINATDLLSHQFTLPTNEREREREREKVKRVTGNLKERKLNFLFKRYWIQHWKFIVEDWEKKREFDLYSVKFPLKSFHSFIASLSLSISLHFISRFTRDCACGFFLRAIMVEQTFHFSFFLTRSLAQYWRVRKKEKKQFLRKNKYYR